MNIPRSSAVVNPRSFTAFAGSIFLMLTLFFLHPAQAAARIEMTTVLGFGDTYRAGTWVPLSIILENHGGPVTSGMLDVQVTQGNEFNKDIYSVIYSRPADLASGAKKIFYFNIFIRTHLHPITISYRQNQDLLFKAERSLRLSVTEKPLLLIATKKVSENFFSAMPETFTPVSSFVEYLPHQWYGYQGVSRIILSPDLIDRLSLPQIAALEKWVQTGGTLITFGRMNTTVFSSAKVKRLLDLSVNGVEKIRGASAVSKYCNSKTAPGSEMWVNRTTIKQADVLLSYQSVPLIYSTKKKDGSIRFIAFDINDPVFLQWEGQQRFWKKLVSFPVDADARLPREMAPVILSEFMANTKTIFPAFAIAGPLLTVYVLLIILLLRQPSPIPYQESQKRICRVLWAVLVLIIFSAGSGVLFVSRTGFSSQISVLNIQENKQMMTRDTYVGVYSPEIAKKQVTAARDNAMVHPVFPKPQEKKTWLGARLQQQDGTWQIALKMDRYSMFHYKVSDRIGSAFQYSLLPGDRGERLSIRNFSKTPLLNCLVYKNGQVFRIGNIQADAKVQKVLSTPVCTINNMTTSLLSEDTKKLVEAFTKGVQDKKKAALASRFIPQLLPAIHQYCRDKPQKLVLAGWVDRKGEKQLPESNAEFVFWEMTGETG